MLCGVTLTLGIRDRLAVEPGEWSGGLRRVDVWAADQRLTCDDNMTYVPQMRQSLLHDRARLGALASTLPPFPGLPPAAVHRQLLADGSGLRENWSFLKWGPTTDNVLAHLVPGGDALMLTVEFWRPQHLQRHPGHAGKVFTAEINMDEQARILDDAITALGDSLTSPAEPQPPGRPSTQNGMLSRDVAPEFRRAAQ
jgi:hypothetical protein